MSTVFSSPSYYLSSDHLPVVDQDDDENRTTTSINNISLVSAASTSPVPQPPLQQQQQQQQQQPIAVKPAISSNNIHVKRWGLSSFSNQNVNHNQHQQQPQLQLHHHKDPYCNNNNNNNGITCTDSVRGISVVSSLNDDDEIHYQDDQQQQQQQQQRSCSVASSSSSASYVVFPTNNNNQQQSTKSTSNSIILLRQQKLQQEATARKIFKTWMNRIHLRRIFAPNLSITNSNSHLVTCRSAHISGPLSFLSLRTTFTRWAYHALRRKNGREAIPELLEIQREANYFLCVEYLDKWKCGASNKKLNTKLFALQQKNENIVRTQFLQEWQSTAQRLHNRRIAVRALSSIFYISQCVLMARYFFKFTRYPEEKRKMIAAVDELSSINHKRHIALTLWRWQRRLRIPYIEKQFLIPMKRQCDRVLVRSAFEKWIRWSCNKMTALMLEQKNLKIVGKQYFRYWRRHTHRMRVVLPCLENIRQRCEKKLIFNHFHKWKSFVDRIVISYSLEQKTFILILQRYYLRLRESLLFV